MEKLTRAIEFFGPNISGYPKWIQFIFFITIVFIAISIALFFLFYPNKKKEVNNNIVNPGSSPFLEISSPKNGEFITTPRITITGKGAKPSDLNSLKVTVLHILTGKSESYVNHVNFKLYSDQTWSFENIQLNQPGEYKLTIDAIFGGNKLTKDIKINYEPNLDNSSEKPNIKLIEFQAIDSIVKDRYKFTLSYIVENKSNKPVDVWLGATLKGSNNKMYYNIAEDTIVTLKPGKDTYSRTLTIKNISPYIYQLVVEVYYGPLSDPDKSVLLGQKTKEIEVKKSK